VPTGLYLEARLMNDPNGLPTEEPSETRRERSTGGSRGGSGFSAARGAALIAVAVILGVVLLNAIDDGNSGPVGDGGSPKSTSTSTTTTTTTAAKDGSSTTSTTKPAPIPPAQVSVLVLNGSGRAGVAGTVTNTLKAKGYKTLPPNNASAVRTGTVVYAKTGKTAVCTTLAASIPGSKVQPMPTPPPTVTDADCIVVVGT
jgi:hypothetical protein